MFSMITKALKALKAGESLKKPEAWKNVQSATNAVTIIIAFLLTVFPDFIDMKEEDVQILAGVIVALVGLVNTYFINATSKKVGIK